MVSILVDLERTSAFFLFPWKFVPYTPKDFWLHARSRGRLERVSAGVMNHFLMRNFFFLQTYNDARHHAFTTSMIVDFDGCVDWLSRREVDSNNDAHTRRQHENALGPVRRSRLLVHVRTDVSDGASRFRNFYQRYGLTTISQPSPPLCLTVRRTVLWHQGKTYVRH